MHQTGLVDTNLLVYFADATDKERHSIAKSFFEEVISKPEYFVVSIQNLREFASVMLEKKKMSRQEVGEYLVYFSELFQSVLMEDFDALYRAATENAGNADFWDALLTETMKHNGISLVYTENVKHFSGLGWLKAVNPLS